MIHRHNIRPGTPAWYEWITASQVAGVVGLDPYRTRAETWRRRDERTSPPLNNAMIWGILHEEDAFDRLQRVTGALYAVNKLLCVNDALPMIAATPDAFDLDTDEPVEIKCPYFSRDAYSTPPLHYMVQLQCQMAVMKAPTCLFVSWTPWDFRIQRVGYSAPFFHRLYDYVGEFWFLKEEPPSFKRGEKQKRTEEFEAFPVEVEEIIK